MFFESIVVNIIAGLIIKLITCPMCGNAEEQDFQESEEGCTRNVRCSECDARGEIVI